MANFTALEFKDLQARAQSVFNDMIKSMQSVKTSCDSLSGIVASDDSDLSARWASVASSIAKPISTAMGSFSEIDGLMNEYVKQTVANEEKAAAELSHIDEEIENLNSSGANLVDLSAIVTGGVGGGPTTPDISSFINNNNIVDNTNISTVYGGPTTPNISNSFVNEYNDILNNNSSNNN